MNNSEKKVLETIMQDLGNSTKTSWTRSGDVSDWSNHAKKMSSEINASITTIRAMITLSKESADNKPKANESSALTTFIINVPDGYKNPNVLFGTVFVIANPANPVKEQFTIKLPHGNWAIESFNNLSNEVILYNLDQIEAQNKKAAASAMVSE